MQLEDMKKNLLSKKSIKGTMMEKYISTMCIDRKKPLGKLSPSSWALEPVRGCNLACGCCATALFPKKKFNFISLKTWEQMITLMKEITPYIRIEFANAGEPTLHPKLTEILRMGREISPFTFFQVITNGTTLIDGKITYDDMFKAGANIIYVDMYAPEDKHISLAKNSGYHWYLRRNKKKEDPAAWTYHRDMGIKCIILQENPYNWGKNKKRTYFSTFFNNLDWEKAKSLNIKPVDLAPRRRCSQPFRVVNVSYDGFYSFCCFDFMRYVYGKIGNVESGVQGFLEFWLGEYMQDVRKRLHNKDRRSHNLCSKCAFCSSYGDIPVWKDDEVLDFYYSNNSWKKNNPELTKIPNLTLSSFF
jgi:hypothetical protein